MNKNYCDEEEIIFYKYNMNQLQEKINKALDLLNKEWFTYNQSEVDKFVNELKEVLGEK